MAMGKKAYPGEKFTVLSVERAEDGKHVRVDAQFRSDSKTYTYYRMPEGEDTMGNEIVYLNGHRVTFNPNTFRFTCETITEKAEQSEQPVTEETKRNRKEIEQLLDNMLREPEKAPCEPSEDVEDMDTLSPEEERLWAEFEAEEQRKELEKEVRHEKYDTIKTCLTCNIPVYLTGPAGSGKNYTVEQIAKEMGWNFYFSNAVQQEYKLTGFIDAGGKYHETEFYKACTDSKECVFFLDEMDASIPEVLVLLNAAIANGYFEFPTGRVDLSHVHFVAAGNTVGSGANDIYTGRMVLDQATLDRFAIVEFTYSEMVEKKLTENNVELIEFVHDLRKSAEKSGIRATFSYRCLIMVTQLEKAGMPLGEILKVAVVKGLDADTVNTFKLKSETKYHKALAVLQNGK